VTKGNGMDHHGLNIEWMSPEQKEKFLQRFFHEGEQTPEGTLSDEGVPTWHGKPLPLGHSHPHRVEGA